MATTKKKPATAKKTATASKALAKVKKKPAAKAAIKSAATKKSSPAKKTLNTKSVTKKPVTKKSAPAKKISAKVVKTKKTETKTPKELKTKNTTSKKIKPVAAKKATKPEATTAGKASKTKSSAHQEMLKKAVKAKKVDEKKKVVKEKPFVMPVTHTDKVREYKPKFEKSILDTPEPKFTGPILRYSDADLQEFKELITRKLEAAKRELNYLQGLITRKGQMGGDESENRYMTMEDGSLSMEREQLSQMASRQITFIDHLEKALIRIENKTYGICRVTGKLIDKARLRAVPHATLSIEAKMGIAK